MINWNDYDFAKKQKHYNKFMCHELNLFLFFKDPAFFQANIKQFISNKLDKSFVDFFLLHDTENL